MSEIIHGDCVSQGALRWLRVSLKLFRARVLNLPTASFCKQCGRDVHDFVAPDEAWERVDQHIRRGHTLCYDCFCAVCSRIGLPAVWAVAELQGDSREMAQ